LKHSFFQIGVQLSFEEEEEEEENREINYQLPKCCQNLSIALKDL